MSGDTTGKNTNIFAIVTRTMVSARRNMNAEKNVMRSAGNGVRSRMEVKKDIMTEGRNIGMTMASILIS